MAREVNGVEEGCDAMSCNDGPTAAEKRTDL